MPRFTRLTLALAAAGLAAACGSSPVSYSAPVGITVHAKSGDVAGGILSESKDVNTESGNPYAAFITDARAKLGNKDPSSIVIDSLTIKLDTSSTGVTKLDDVFTGAVDVQFVMNTSNNAFPVGTITSPTGPGPDALTVSFDDSTMLTADRAALIAGQFKVVLHGTPAAAFSGKGADATLDLTFTFAALE